jgi:hypothetical protein
MNNLQQLTSPITTPQSPSKCNAWVRTQEYKRDEKLNGPLRKAIPVMSLTWASVCCFMNIVVPGSGRTCSPVIVTYFTFSRHTLVSISLSTG